MLTNHPLAVNEIKPGKTRSDSVGTSLCQPEAFCYSQNLISYLISHLKFSDPDGEEKTVIDGVRVRNSRDRTISFILSRLLRRKKLRNTEGLILTTLFIYLKFLDNMHKIPPKRLEVIIQEALACIDQYLKVKLYGFPNLQAFYKSL